jgi:hypothetical protein
MGLVRGWNCRFERYSKVVEWRDLDWILMMGVCMYVYLVAIY